MRALLIVAVLLIPTLARAAGIASVEIPADPDGPALKATIWTPCAKPAEEMQLGPIVLRGQRNCPVEGNHLPLIVISHGHGGSNLGHHDLAESLADADFVVAAINHPGDSYADMSSAGDIANFVERPKDIKRLIDYMIEHGTGGKQIDAKRIGFFGFSRGGYTGLVLAGANPDFLHANVPCDDPAIPLCAQIKRQEMPSEPLTHDTRIKAFVIADPLNMFPTPESLKQVQAPLQLWSSEFGGDGVLPGTGAALENMLPVKPDFHIVPGSAHFAFLAPCSAALTKMAPDICIDQAGFDRVALHQQLNASALAFYKHHL
jgi:predicted dienelactone hydrolase